MKFLSKYPTSAILAENITYKKGQTENNRELLLMLLTEQRNFCAYTEKYIEDLDSCEIEHLNPAKKYNDDYYNYYGVLRIANQLKMRKDKRFSNASFHNTLFFQDGTQVNSRIRYVEGEYEEIDKNDVEAKELIEYLGFNEKVVYDQRKKHIRRIKEGFEARNFTSDEQKREYFKNHIEDLSFITALEVELGMQLSDLI